MDVGEGGRKSGHEARFVLRRAMTDSSLPSSISKKAKSGEELFSPRPPNSASLLAKEAPVRQRKTIFFFVETH